MRVEIIQEKIEILGLDLFETHQEEMNIVENIKRELNWEIGWHYLLDLAWMLREISRLPKGSLILDAGAGKGLAQFILADLGYNVISVDLAGRFSYLRKIKKYGSSVYNLNENASSLKDIRDRGIYSFITYICNRLISGGKPENNAPELIARKRYTPTIGSDGNFRRNKSTEYGRIFIYRSNLNNMALLPDNFVDGVISISALEHNNHQDFTRCLNEILRVAKRGCILALTVSASQSGDWFHEPSKGWCYSESSLRNLFRLPITAKSNFTRKEEFMDKLRKEGNKLHKRLDAMYYRSGNNGMPWGKWDPRYQPVGIVTRKLEG
jgi:SAM-dependent methyltransferase